MSTLLLHHWNVIKQSTDTIKGTNTKLVLYRVFHYFPSILSNSRNTETGQCKTSKILTWSNELKLSSSKDWESSSSDLDTSFRRSNSASRRIYHIDLQENVPKCNVTLAVEIRTNTKETKSWVLEVVYVGPQPRTLFSKMREEYRWRNATDSVKSLAWWFEVTGGLVIFQLMAFAHTRSSVHWPANKLKLCVRVTTEDSTICPKKPHAIFYMNSGLFKSQTCSLFCTGWYIKRC